MLWGTLGGALVVGLEFVGIVRRTGDWPWRARKELRPAPYVVATLVRLLLGSGLAAAAGQSHLVANSVTAVTIGIATPLIVEKLARAGADITRGGLE
jgi:hypothetical protein